MPQHKKTLASWDIKGIVPDVDGGGIITQPYAIRQTHPDKNIIPEDVYATRPFYFGGSNVRFYKKVDKK